MICNGVHALFDLQLLAAMKEVLTAMPLSDNKFSISFHIFCSLSLHDKDQLHAVNIVDPLIKWCKGMTKTSLVA